MSMVLSNTSQHAADARKITQEECSADIITLTFCRMCDGSSYHFDPPQQAGMKPSQQPAATKDNQEKVKKKKKNTIIPGLKELFYFFFFFLRRQMKESGSKGVKIKSNGHSFESLWCPVGLWAIVCSCQSRQPLTSCLACCNLTNYTGLDHINASCFLLGH